MHRNFFFEFLVNPMKTTLFGSGGEYSAPPKNNFPFGPGRGVFRSPYKKSPEC